MERVYIGIPEELITKIWWKDWRNGKRERHSQNFGSDVIIEYKNGKADGYDWLKYPSRFVQDLFKQEFLNENEDELVSIKKHISRIFARRYESENFQSQEFIEIWNDENTDQLPYKVLEIFAPDSSEKYLNLFMSDLEFATTYLSMYFPFKYEDIINNWDLLEKGDAHYAVFINDTDEIYNSHFGLSYNKNLRWNSKLRARYDYGFWNPFLGHVEGINKGPVEIDERDFLDMMIPLESIIEISSRNNAIIDHFSQVILPNHDINEREDIDGPNTYDEEYIFKSIGPLEFDEFVKYFEKEKLRIIVNESFWLMTLRHIIDDDFCHMIFEELKKTTRVRDPNAEANKNISNM